MEIEKISVQIVFDNFKNISDNQRIQFENLYEIYEDWNAKINLISRKDFPNFYLKHVLHSLSILKFLNFTTDSKILDLGCGGGFPGIPLAIMLPNVQFHLVDSIGKKITVVQDIIQQLNLKNTRAENKRVELLKTQYDFVVSRAVAESKQIIHWSEKLILKQNKNALPNGWLLLKGGNLIDEMKEVPKHYEIFPIIDYLKNDFFEGKHLVYIEK
jgi:16S rRNA (guanine527-N7)-methyltransferase